MVLVSGALPFLQAQAQGQPRAGGTMVLAQAISDPPVIAYFVNTADRVPGSNVFSGLIQQDAAFNPLPDLATNWEFSSDQLTWTFHLVKNATWHDGIPFTSADVKFSYEELIPLTGDGQIFFSKDDLARISTPDNYTVVFQWKHPFVEALSNMGVFAAPIGPMHLYQGTDYRNNPYNLKPIGTGPFKFQEWIRGDHATFVKDEHYFKKGLPYLDKIVFRFISDMASLVSALKAGQVDYFPDGLPYSLVADLNKDPNFAPVPLNPTAAGQVVRLAFNLDNPVFQDVRVRRAFSLAVDRQTIVDKAAYGYGKVSKSIFTDTPALARYRSPNVPNPKYDPAAAEKLLDDAGYKRDANGVRSGLGTLRFVTQTSPPEVYSDPASLIRDTLKNIGVQVNIVAVDTGTRLKVMYVDRPRGFDIAINRARTGPTPLFSKKAWTSQFIQKAIFTNLGYNNSAIDKLYAQIGVTANADQLVKLYQQVDEILNNDVPELWLYDYSYAQPRRNTFQGDSFYSIISESGPVEKVWWTQGTPITTTAVTSAASTKAAQPTGGMDMTTIGAIVVLIVVVAGAALYMSKRKKTTPK
ncbi:MAG: ABC transporter substrate-binding protein [Candidatus Bathyarchaeia archaeon]